MSEPQSAPERRPRQQPTLVRTIRRWVVAAFCLSAAVAAVVMLQASQLLGLVQSDEQSVYTMSDLTRFPIPVEPDRVVAAFEAWRATALPDGATAVDGGTTALLGLIRNTIFWHVALDFMLFAPAVSLLLRWLLRRSFVNPLGPVLSSLPFLYLIVDWAETLLTWRLADGYLRVDDAALPADLTMTLTWLTLGKWVLLIVALVIATLGALARDPRFRFRGVKTLGRTLWSVRVQVIAVLVFAVLVALPISGPLDQIPDLLRSAYDEGWDSSAVWIPLLLVLGLTLLLWTSGLLIAREVPTEDPTTDGRLMPRGRDYVKSRLPWWLMTAVLAAIAAGLYWGRGGLRTAGGVWAAPVVALTLAILDGVLLWLVHKQIVSDAIAASPPLLRRGDEAALEKVVLVLAAAPLAIAGFGAVRAYAPLVLLQSGDPLRTPHAGATDWFWVGAVVAVVAPLVVVSLLRRAVPRKPRRPAGVVASRRPDLHATPFTVALVAILVVLALVFAALARNAMDDPARAGRSLEAHGLIVVWLSVLVVVLGLLQWRSEREDPVALAKVLGLARTPWILLVVVVLLVAGSMDTKVGYHSVTLQDKGQVAERESVDDAFTRWYRIAKKCRTGADTLPLVLVAAPGGGARAAYWTSHVMTRIQATHPCAASSIFLGSGVSGGSVGLAVWTATAGAGGPVAEEAIGDLVDREALSATVAAMLFRDLPRAFLGIHPYGVDRAAVEQDVWVDKVSGLDDPFFTKGDTKTWRPLLALNASDIATGCKVLISQVQVHSPMPTTPSSQQCKQHPSEEAVAPTAIEAGAVDAGLFLDPAHCPDVEESTGAGDAATANISLAAAALMSARFPYVSPSGALTACDDDPPERLYVADGGYLENTGLHTLLAIWQDLEPLVSAVNAKPSPRVVPIAVLVENHYRSEATSRPGARVRELTGPPSADRTGLLRSESLEQAAAAEFGQSVPGVGGKRQRWFVVAPSTQPDLSAPLGWSLSEASRTALDCQIPKNLPAARGSTPCAHVPDGADLEDLVAALRGK